VVSASFTPFSIIPVNTTQDVSVTLSPNPPGTNITLQLSCLSGSGSAVFAPDGSTSTNITQSTTVKIKGVTASSVASNMILKAMLGNDMFASNKFSIVNMEMTAYRPQTEGPGYGSPFQKRAITNTLEENPGAGIRVNGDDDNNNSTADSSDTSVSGENDLIEVELKAEPASGIKYVLKRSSSNIKVWNSQTKGTALLDSGTEAEISFSASTKTVWVENPSGGSADLEFIVRSGETDVCSDKVHFYPFTSIVIALGGETQDPSDPSDNGTFQLATNLYQQGYDVHMYDEDDVDYGGAGATYNEVVNSIQHRSVSQVAIFGFSHGGGSTYLLADLLNTHRDTIGTFTIPFTAYIDAVEDTFMGDMNQEHRRPTSSAYHVNYYQEGSVADGWLDGGPIDYPPGADYEINVDYPTPTETHLTIDNETTVLDGIETRLTPRINR